MKSESIQEKIQEASNTLADLEAIIRRDYNTPIENINTNDYLLINVPDHYIRTAQYFRYYYQHTKNPRIDRKDMNEKIYIPSKGPDSWKEFLAQPDKQWETGFSAKTMAHYWEDQSGFPKEFKKSLNDSGLDLDILLAIPEYKVYLDNNKAPSQNDLFVKFHKVVYDNLFDYYISKLTQ